MKTANMMDNLLPEQGVNGREQIQKRLELG